MQAIHHAVESTLDWGLNKLSQLEDWTANNVLSGWTPRDIPDLTGKVALVTGGNSGLGYQTARKLAENGAHVYIVSRDINNGHKIVAQLREEFGKQVQVDTLGCDLSSLENVVALAQEFKRSNTKLDLLVNVAGVFQPGPFALTPDGLEQTLGINFYAHLLLTLLLLDTLRETPGSRVVFMASAAELFGRLNWHNLTGEFYKDSGLTPYGTSKMCSLMALKELAVRVPEVDFLCAHPGLAWTEIRFKTDFRYLMAALPVTAAKFVALTPYFAAYSAMYAATEPSLTGSHFGYYGPTMYNMFPTGARKPGNPLSYLLPSWMGAGPDLPLWLSRPTASPANCMRLLEEAVHILQQKLKRSDIKLSVPQRPVSNNNWA